MKLVLEEEYTEALRKAVEVLKGGGIIIYPTETVYGIGGNALDAEVVEKIRRIKGRGEKPFSVIMGSLEMVRKYCKAEGKTLQHLMEHLPGAYTFILEEKAPAPFSEKGKIGVRVPLHHFLRKVVLEAGVPLIGTSANLSGKKPSTTLSEVDDKLLEQADLIIDGGKTHFSEPSTVVDLAEKRIIRKGAGEFSF